MSKPAQPDSSTGSGSGAPKKKGRCPRCGKEFLYESVAKFKTFPFCSQRCRDVDLGNWMTGKYVIPGKEPVNPDEAFQAPEAESDDDGT